MIPNPTLLKRKIMNTWQAAFNRWHTEVYLNTPSVELEPHMHVSHGMTRTCELDLLCKIATGHSYIEIGSGRGFSLLLMKSMGIECFGFDHLSEVLDGLGTSYINCEILKGSQITEEFQERFTVLVRGVAGAGAGAGAGAAAPPLFVYCDNGHKVEELRYVAPLLSKGDILGTHDWPTEVPEDFSLDGYELITEYDEYIKHYACLQRFWQKK